MMRLDAASFVDSSSDSEDEIDHFHRKAREALDKAKTRQYPIFAIRSNIAFNAEMLASEDVPLPGQMVTFGVRDYLHIKARFSQDWWIARLVRIGSSLGFIPTPAKIESIRQSILQASSSSTTAAPSNVQGAMNTAGGIDGQNNNTEGNAINPNYNSSFEENPENTTANLGERPLMFNQQRNGAIPNAGPIQNLAASRRLVPEIDEDAIDPNADMATNGNEAANNNQSSNQVNQKNTNQKTPNTGPGIKKKPFNKKSQLIQPYELVPCMRPVVFLGPALKGFEVTDMMQKAIFDFLKKHFEGRIIITRISSDLTQMKRITSGNTEKKLAAAMATQNIDNNPSTLPSNGFSATNMNSMNDNYNSNSLGNNNNATVTNTNNPNGPNSVPDSAMVQGGKFKKNLGSSDHSSKSLKNIQQDIERIYELSSHMQLVVLDADTINHPGQLNKTCLAPLLVYIKIVSMKVLSKLIKNRGKSQKNNASFQLSAAEKLQQCPDESFDLILDQNNLAGASECLRHFLETYWVATHPQHAQTKAERILQSRGEHPPFLNHSFYRKMSKSDPEFAGANILLQAGLQEGFTVKEMNSLVTTSMWWAAIDPTPTAGTGSSGASKSNTLTSGGPPGYDGDSPPVSGDVGWGGDPEEYRSNREMRVDQKDRVGNALGSVTGPGGNKQGTGNPDDEETVTPLLKPVSPDIFMSKLSLKSQLLTHTATSNHMAPMNNHESEPTKMYQSRSILHQKQRLAELEEKKKNEKDLARQRRRLVRINEQQQQQALQQQQNQMDQDGKHESASGKALAAIAAFAKGSW